MNIPFYNFINNQLNPQLICPVPNNNNLVSQPVAPIPPGLEALYLHCHQIYPEQPNPLQLTSVKKYWLGGNNFLDYITLYNNPGDPKKNVPPHWHYISFGLSDLYGDGRLHPKPLNSEVSGFGFELTFRLKRDPNDYVAPIWPANIMQSLARYVFHTGNILCSGDHVSENKPLDNSDSKIQHMLMTDDPQLGTVIGPLGKVAFIQIVGVTNEELKASQQWNVNGIIDLMKKIHDVGGDYLVTDMQRSKTIFEINKDVKLAVERGINNEGSNLSGVSAKCSFQSKISLEFVKNFTETDEENTSSVNEEDCSDENSEDYETDTFSESSDKNSSSDKEIDNKKENKNESIENHLDQLKEGISNINISSKKEDTKEEVKVEVEKKEINDNKKESVNSSQPVTSPIKSECSSSMSVSHENQNNNCTSSMSYSSETGVMEPFNCLEPKYLKEVHITLNLEAGLLLPLALKGRLKHNHHFTYKSTNLAITFLTPSVTGSYVTPEKPFAYYGSWLQILLQNNLIEEMLADLEDLEDMLLPEFLPRTFCWRNIAITFEPDER